MNIVFINPSEDRYSRGVWQSKLLRVILGKSRSVMPKLSAMIFAALTPERHRFVYIDEETDYVKHDIDADLVAITMVTEQATRAYQIAGEFRRRGKTVVMGGIHASVRREEAASHCDSIMLGEGEHTWPAMLEDFENGRLKKIYDSRDYPPVEKLISPRLDVVNFDHYLSFPIQATRGCPYNCEFCSIEFSSGHQYRMKPVEQVVAEIRAFQSYNSGGFAKVLTKGFYFVDDNLYVNREYVKELMIALKPLGIKFDCQGTVNIAKDEEILKLMAEAGCRSLAIGFESINPGSLAEANKPKVNHIEEYQAVIRNMAKYGIVVVGYFIFGFDHDEVSVFETTLDFVKGSDLVMSFSNLLTPYPGTRFYDRIKDRIYNISPNAYNAWTAVFTPKSMSAEDLQTGVLWFGIEITDLDFMWTQLKKFWSYGPWETNPPINFGERVALIYVGIRMFFAGEPAYTRFAFRVAFCRNAADFQEIFWFMRRYDLTVKVPNIGNPAKKSEWVHQFIKSIG